MTKQVEPWQGWDIIQDNDRSLVYGFFIDGNLRGTVTRPLPQRKPRYLAACISLSGRSLHKETFSDVHAAKSWIEHYYRDSYDGCLNARIDDK